MAFVVITHQHPGHTSLLPELLGKATAIPVVEAADGLKVEPNHVYVSPPGGYLAILNGTLHRMETEKKEAPHLPIDYFFRSLAEDQKEQGHLHHPLRHGHRRHARLEGDQGRVGHGDGAAGAVGQIRRDAEQRGRDGARGLRAAGGGDAGQLVAYARGPYPDGATRAADVTRGTAEPMQKIFVLLRSRTGHDFSSYKSSTIRRRIERRMNLHQIKGPASMSATSRKTRTRSTSCSRSC